MNFTRILPVVTATLLFAAPAHATCLNTCKATLIGPGCATPTHAAAGDPIWFLITCQTCCSPPGGPLNCTDIDPYSETFSVQTADGKKVDGFVSPSQMACPGLQGAMFAFIPAGGSLAAGTYNLINGSMILLEFDQFAAGGCKTSADCGACSECSSGSCKAVGTVACSADLPCAKGLQCQIDPVAPCKNACVVDGAIDAGSADVGPLADVSADTKTADQSTAPDAAAEVAIADSGSLPDVLGAADLGADASVGPDVQVDTAPPAASTKAASGCQTGTPAPASGWMLSLILAGWALVRRRRSDQGGAV